MKRTSLCFLLLLGGPLLAQNTASSGTPPAADEKSRAVAINQELVVIAHGGDSSDARWQAVDGEIDGYQKQFGVTPQTTHNVVTLRRTELAVAKHLGNEARYEALVEKLASDPVPDVAALVTKVAALKTKPVDLKFTAVDGRAVDISSLQGKVVLVDFWATWCGPCVDEMPNVIATYKKYHAQGFEIVGISLDEDKSALVAFTKQQGMEWPQYFDGKGWKNAISSSYDITSIPTMWLIDKKGMLVTMNVRDDLDAQVGKLLAAP